MQRRTAAWTLSVIVHAVVLAVAIMLARSHAPPPTTPESDVLVYVEPAPPPPPPAPSPASLEVPHQPEPTPHPTDTRLVEPTEQRAPRRPKPVEPPRVAPPEPAGEEGGVPGGVPGGVVGGELGGVVGGRGDAPIPADRVAQPPVPVTRTLPEYLPYARTRGVEGQVLLQAVVDQQGHIEHDVTVLRSIPLLDEAAITALRRWEFRPGRDSDGRLVRVLVEVPIRFQLR